MDTYGDPITPAVLTARLRDKPFAAGATTKLVWFDDPGIPEPGDTSIAYNSASDDYGPSTWHQRWSSLVDGDVPMGDGYRQGLNFDSEWHYYNFSHPERPLWLPAVRELIEKSQDGTGIGHGGNDEYGANYPEGFYGYNYWSGEYVGGAASTGSLYGFVRREWGYVQPIFGGPIPVARTFHRLWWNWRNDMFLRVDSPPFESSDYGGAGVWTRPQYPDGGGGAFTPGWTPAVSGYAQPDDAAGYEIVTPGQVVGRRLRIAVRSTTSGVARRDGNERIIIGVHHGDPSQGTHGTWQDYGETVANTRVLLSLPMPPMTVPPSGHYEDPEGDNILQYVEDVPTYLRVLLVDLPDSFQPGPDDYLVAFGTPSIAPTYTSLEAEPGFSPEAFDPDQWSWRWGPLQRAPGDLDEDDYTLEASLMFRVEHLYQPPVFRWVYSPPTVSTPAPVLRLWPRADGHGPVSAPPRLSEVSPFKQSGFHPGSIP